MTEVSLSTLDTGDIHQRADVGRQLSKYGRPEHISRLITAARDDNSPGVRLYAIGAAADILSRYRVGPAAAEIDAATRKQLLKQVRSIDPARNAGMFSVLANLALPETRRPILVGLRDPRLDVRTGASVGIYRYCISSAATDDAEVRAEVIGLLDDPRVRPDVRANLVRLCAGCGWSEAAPLLRSFLERGDQVSAAAEQALAWLEHLDRTDNLVGVWWSDGVDAGQVDPEPGPRTWMLMGEGVGVEGPIDALSATRWTLSDARTLVVEGESAPRALRRMMLPPPGSEERGPAFQADGRTWYRATPAALLEVAEPLFDAIEGGLLPPAERARLVDPLLSELDDSPAGRRLAARLELVAGRPAAAVERLDALLKGKRPPVELFFLLGKAHAAAGDAAAAEKAFRAFVEKAPKRSPLLPEALAALGEA